VSAQLTVITLTRDEERNIVECLESVAWAQEIIVIDSGSTDRTVELARRFTPNATVLPWRGYGAARNEGLARSHSGWILWLDADERVTPELAAEIRGILEKDDPGVAGYEIARRAYFCGKWIRHGGWYPSRVVRLFRREKARFSETRVHERILIEGAVCAHPARPHPLYRPRSGPLFHEIQLLHVARRPGHVRGGKEFLRRRSDLPAPVSVLQDVPVAAGVPRRDPRVRALRRVFRVRVHEIRQALGAETDGKKH
jgi:glycosyltransferase involved in cell wall biosynthesis